MLSVSVLVMRLARGNVDRPRRFGSFRRSDPSRCMVAFTKTLTDSLRSICPKNQGQEKQKAARPVASTLATRRFRSEVRLDDGTTNTGDGWVSPSRWA